ncbi:stage III sporulation protein AF [Lacrimispora sp.]|jgi:stage III sporulation protein AF|uniref:stage III sporulation protein AF n=1 Tax=Lacrimispora sp. TaxID=2719234 RepID=UPI0028B23395|nr:stage III sporulation protein AF [Lacrimispora sp.]
MEQLFEWIRSIIYYLIFITVVANLLPNKKYEKYIRFFAGMVLILLVLKPITGGLRLDDTLAYYFESITLKKEATELTGEIAKMDGQRLDKMITKYEDAVSGDLKAMAVSAGFNCNVSKAEINEDQDSKNFGHVVRVSLVLKPESEEGEEEAIPAVEGMEPIQKVAKVEGIKITPSPSSQGENVRQEENSQVSGLRKKIAEYYGLEEQDIEIQVEDGKG